MRQVYPGSHSAANPEIGVDSDEGSGEEPGLGQAHTEDAVALGAVVEELGIESVTGPWCFPSGYAV